MLSLFLLAVAGPSVAEAAAPAAAPCPVGKPGEIVVCKRPDDKDRYRLPIRTDRGFDPLGSVDSVSRERYRLLDGDGAGQDLTRGSCSTVGASGATGCMIKTWREHDQMKGW